MERIARQARSAIDKVVEPGKRVSRSEERRKALEKDRYRSGYDQIDWGSNREAAAQEELERWRAIEAVRKSEAYFAILGLPPCPKCKAKVEYVEGPPEKFRMCRHAWWALQFMPQVRSVIQGAARVDGKEVEFVDDFPCC